MKKELSKKLKIAIGVSAFVIIMAAIVWIVALALLDTDINTEVYGTEFDYVDDTMYDNAYITVKGGRWQLYRGGDAISRTFGYLEYAGEGRFSFINNDGKGWGFVRTDGTVEAEFNQDFRPLRPGTSSLVAVRDNGDGEFTVRNNDGKSYRGKGHVLEYSDFPAFYDAYDDAYVAFFDENGKCVALKTEKFEELPLKFSPSDTAVGNDGFLTVTKSTGAVTYDSLFGKVSFLDGLTPSKGDAYYEVVDGCAVAYRTSTFGGEVTVTTRPSVRGAGFTGEVTFTVSVGDEVIATNGKVAVVRHETEYIYFDGAALRNVEDFSVTEITGGNLLSFRLKSADRYILLDKNYNEAYAADFETVALYRTKEKNRAQYTVKIECLLADGSLYGYENGELKRYLDNVISVVSSRDFEESRIITQGDGITEIYDSFFRSKDRKTNLAAPTVIDAFIPVYSQIKDGKRNIRMPRGEFEAGLTTKVEIMFCKDEDNYFAVETQDSGMKQVHGKNGALLGSFNLSEDEEIVMSPTQLCIVGAQGINIVSRDKFVEVKYDELFYSRSHRYAVAVRSNGLSVINLDSGNIDDERFISGGIEITEIGENAFVFQNVKTKLYGIISDGKMTLSPTYRYMELHDNFVIASVDDESANAITYFQADFGGKRISDVYFDLEVTEGLTMGAVSDGSMEIMNARGRVILKNVTHVPELDGGGFDFMKCQVYDEETGLTVPAVRRDNSRLLVVTAGGYKRVISISKED